MTRVMKATNDKTDNNKNKIIESGMQKSGNSEENDLRIVDGVETGRPNHTKRKPARFNVWHTQEQTLTW